MIRATTQSATRHAWKVIILWTLVCGALTVLGPGLMSRASDAQTGDFLPKKYDSAAAMKIAEDRFGVSSDTTPVTVLVARTDGAKLDAKDQGRIKQTADRLGTRHIEMPDKGDTPLQKDHSQTPRVELGPAAPDGTFQLVTASLKGGATDAGVQSVYKEFRKAAQAELGADGLRVGFTGPVADAVDTDDANASTTEIAGLLAVGLIVLLNILVFRSVLAAIVPLLAVMLVGGAATGAVAGVALLTGIKLDSSVPSLISVVLLGIGVDYFLFLMFRFREQLRTHPDQHKREAAAITAGKVGTAITCAALTIVAAFATLGVASFGQFRVLGPSIAVAVLVMLLASLTLMPALLAVCGRGLFWPARAWKRDRRGGLAARWGERVARKPGRTALGALALLAALAAGVVGVKMNYDIGGSQSDTPAAKTAAEISRALPAGASDPHTVYIEAENGVRLDDKAVGALGKALTGVPGVGQVAQPEYDPAHTAARIDVILSADSNTQEARDLVSGPVRDTVRKATPPGAEAHVTGTAAIFADVSEAVDHDLKVVFPVAAALIMLILFLLLRCLLAPLVMMLAVGLGFAATLGASALVFQHAAQRPGVVFTLPLVLFLFVVALGTDYNILISDRLREEMAEPGSARQAVARAVRHTAPAIATAGVVLAGSFASLSVNPDTSMQEVGFATGLGILLSAFVLSLALVPAVAALLGRAIWWPRRGISGSATVTDMKRAEFATTTPDTVPAR
ncbi:MMPL family transporter [Yinghuangia seranimata]|uniref:MMPL family transporter n=1 Tax=Yinghuangia seranimata TaxID=408067 RepID=UPI00248C74FA|nr:MMPL family transporter [Yinghuangia seranimata]MDI2130910.1 MMPL family transporter [Yinghuangia seranimata]